MTSSFTISLDFELRWGIRDNPNEEAYADAILGGRRAIPQMLRAFEDHGVAATWATVGYLFAETREELLSHLPATRPDYANPHFSPYDDVQNRVGQGEADDPLHYGLSLIRQIEDTPGQEIGSHSFSHFYCLEEGATAEAFATDMAAAQKIARSKGIITQSLVLPRNQQSASHLIAARQAGITVFRGTPEVAFYQPRARTDERQHWRALRLFDSAVPLTSTLATPVHNAISGLINTPASRFLRPLRSTSSLMAKAQRRRIKGEMTKAARQGKNYHLWWHPHNFGRATEANMENLLALLRHFVSLRDSHGMQAMTMLDLAQSVSAKR